MVKRWPFVSTELAERYRIFDVLRGVIYRSRSTSKIFRI